MFARSADFYDLLYGFKDYEAEVRQLRELIAERERRPSRSLLDAACGTGAHLALLSESFDVEGFDLDEGMIAAARERLPDVPLHVADFLDVELGARFDVVTCLFSSIAYVRTKERLDRAVARLARHLEPGGLLVLEPWISPEALKPAAFHVHSGQDETRAVTRMSTSRLEDGCTVLEFHYLLGDAEAGIRHVTETHALGLFSDADYSSALESAGLVDVEKIPDGLMDRGLWFAHAPEAAS